MPKISFIIPSYNSFNTIVQTLESIFLLKTPESAYEIIIVDCSDDTKTRNLLQNYVHPNLQMIQLERKDSPAHSRNIGASKATGELLCFIDSDVFLDDSWLNHVLKAYDSGCLIGGGSVGIPNFQNKNLLALAQLYLQFNECLSSGQMRRIAMLPACNMFVQKELFEQVGGFPQLRAAEDVMFCLNCSQYTSVWFVPEAKCFHIFRQEKKSYYQNQIVLGKHIIIYRRLFYKKWYYSELWPIVFLPFFLMIKTSRIIYRIAKSGHEHLKQFILSFPLFLVGLFYWSVGFYQGSQQAITENQYAK